MDRAKRGKPSKTSDATTLNDLGISRDQSADWQKMGEVPDDEFEVEGSFANLRATQAVASDCRSRVDLRDPPITPFAPRLGSTEPCGFQSHKSHFWAKMTLGTRTLDFGETGC